MWERSSQFVRYRNLFRHVENPWPLLARKFGLASRGPLELRLRHGVSVRVPCNFNEFKCLVLDDCYFKGFQHAAFAGVSRPVVVDVGANLGYFSLFAKSRLPHARIVCVEPLERNFRVLSDNIRQSGVAQGEITPVRTALGSELGTLQLGIDGDDECPTGASVFAAGSASKCETVPCQRLEDLLATHQIDRVSLLKLDCEGAEYQIVDSLSPGVFARIDNVAMECHPGSGVHENVGHLERVLASNGFSVCVARDGKFLWASRDARYLVEPPRKLAKAA